MMRDINILAVIVSPANAPAPTLPTNIPSRPQLHQPGPPKGAHQGIWVIESVVGNGWGRQINTTAKKATVGKRDTKLPNQGLTSAFLERCSWAVPTPDAHPR